MRRTRVPPKVKKSTQLQGPQCSPELAFRSTDIRVPENLIFLALQSLFLVLSNTANTLFL